MKSRTPAPSAQSPRARTAGPAIAEMSNGEALLGSERPEAESQRPLQRMLDASARVARRGAQADMVHRSPRSVTQRRAITQVFGAAVVQRAGDPEGLMPEHHASGFTYHHIIPENKLHKLWETLEDKNHTKELKGGLGHVVERGLGQLKSAATGNIKRDLRKEIGEIANGWADEKFDAIVNDAIAGASPDALTAKYFPGLEDKQHEYHSSYLNIKTIFNKRFKVIGESTGEDVKGTVAADGGEFLADAGAKAVVNKLLMWMPGNIHRGPSKRFVPGDTGFDKDLDDGGDAFEEAAKQVIPPKQFETVKELDEKIDVYLGNPSGTAALPRIGELLEAMKAYSVTDYDLANWEEVTLGGTNAETKGKKKQETGKKAWRLKKKA